MDTLPLRQPNLQFQKPMLHKAGPSQTTIDLYLKPIAKVMQGQNDIRKYFPLVIKPKTTQNSRTGQPEISAKASLDDGGAQTRHAHVPSPNVQRPAESILSISDNRPHGKKPAGVFAGAQSHSHTNSAVLPSFDPLFDDEKFQHSTRPMAPRVTEIMRHSLIPKPLNIKMPPPPADRDRSPSEATSSPSSVGDSDSASLDGEMREAPSFKQTYLSVHSRHNTNDSPISPLTALRNPSPKPSRRRVERPPTRRSQTMPQLSEPDVADSVIYFLPTISPTSESSTDERISLMRTHYSKKLDKTSRRNLTRSERQAVRSDDIGLARKDKRIEAPREKVVTISPGKPRLCIGGILLLRDTGLQRYYDYLASQKNATPANDKNKEREKVDRRRRGEETPPFDRTDSGSSNKK